jgi:hypothetical protein
MDRSLRPGEPKAPRHGGARDDVSIAVGNVGNDVMIGVAGDWWHRASRFCDEGAARLFEILDANRRNDAADLARERSTHRESTRELAHIGESDSVDRIQMITNGMAVKNLDSRVPWLQNEDAGVYGARIGHGTLQNPREQPLPSRERRKTPPEEQKPVGHLGYRVRVWGTTCVNLEDVGALGQLSGNENDT